MATKRKYYAVVAGYEPGIYETWTQCELQVKGYKGQKYKSFPTKAEAEKWMELESSKRISTAESRPLQLAVASKSVAIKKTKGIQVAHHSSPFEKGRSNPFKKNAFHISSSVLEMPPDDYKEVRVETCTSVEEPTPIQLPTYLNADQDCISDVDALYQLEYDGASKGNPGHAGAGALLRHPDGTVVCEVSVGLGKATNNVAEYRGLIAGLRKALDLGIQRIQAQGDSKLVTMQVRGKWKINNANLAVLCEEATELLKNFKEFQICHVDREYNSAADLLANKGVGLPEEQFVSSFASSN